jgi:uncharacterized protein (TIGR03437 family)
MIRFRPAAAVFLFASTLAAAPVLRLSSSTVGPISVAQGAAGPAQEVEIYNEGDGSLNLTATSATSWLSASLQPARSCSVRPGSCVPLRIALNTASLAAGRHAASVHVTSAGAIDGAQNVLVVVQVGGGVPAEMNFFLPPNGASTDREIHTLSPVFTSVSTQSGGGWLTVAAQGGSFRFAVPYKVRVRHLEGMAEGIYTGAVQFSGSSFAAENRTTTVRLRVTAEPIAQASPPLLQLRLPQGTSKHTSRVSIFNAGVGRLNVGAASVSGAAWLSAAKLEGYDLVDIAADPGNLPPGSYQGMVTVASNAVNGPLAIPVHLEIVPQRAPAIFPGLVLNNATFEEFEQVSQGGIAAVFGEQFHYGDPIQAPSLPLPERLGETRVLVNGRPAPVYYVSYGQINFQVPYDAEPGVISVVVERSGRPSSPTTIRLQPRKPKMLRLLDSGNEAFYGIIVNTDGTFPIARRFHFPNSRPAREGDVLTIYLLGLGPTEPAVASGAAAPSNPLARVPGNWRVVFGSGIFVSGIPVEPLYVGLTPGFVGLYQINVRVPEGVQKDDRVAIYLQGDTIGSDHTFLAIE